MGARIKAAADKPEFDREFNVLDGKEINAFCLPGGKVAFWEAIIPLCEADDGIAVVTGHEVAHALAHHGAERMSQGMGANVIGEVLSAGSEGRSGKGAGRKPKLQPKWTEIAGYRGLTFSENMLQYDAVSYHIR